MSAIRSPSDIANGIAEGGTLKSASRIYAWGADAESMWNHFVDLMGEAARLGLEARQWLPPAW